jgi:hypothetical protein
MTAANGNASPQSAASSQPKDPLWQLKDPRFIRGDADMLCIWAFCRRHACRRSQTCRSTGEQCVRTYAHLVPIEARAGYLRLFWNRDQGLNFDEAIADVEGSDEGQALLAWQETAEAMHRKRR